MATTTTKPVHSLIIDAGPIIKNEPSISTLLSHAEAIYTIPAVIDEIRDATTRARIESTLLPFLKLRQPRSASIKIIADFARKTGDSEVLSKPDIHLMALAYELECERNHGDWRLRSVPGQKKINGAPPESLKGGPDSSQVPEKDQGKQEGEVEGKEEEKADAKEEAKAEEKSEDKVDEKSTEVVTPAEKTVPVTRGAWGTVLPIQTTEVELSEAEQKLRNTHIETQLAQRAAEAAALGLSIKPSEAPVELAAGEADVVEEVDDVSDDSDAEGWITPANLKMHQEKDANTSATPAGKPASTMQVALITTDFAMQNVLLRMNLNLLSPSLQTIRQLKTWVLRCHACFSITKDMTKQFCGRCGQPSLIRTSCSTDKDGNFRVHLKKNMQYNTRGNVFSIPKLVAGTSHGRITSGGGKGAWGQGLILAEDQKEYVRAMTVNKRQKDKDLMDEDYLPSILTGDRGRAGGRPKVGAGRNVNARRKK